MTETSTRIPLTLTARTAAVHPAALPPASPLAAAAGSPSFGPAVDPYRPRDLTQVCCGQPHSHADGHYGPPDF